MTSWIAMFFCKYLEHFADMSVITVLFIQVVVELLSSHIPMRLILESVIFLIKCSRKCLKHGSAFFMRIVVVICRLGEGCLSPLIIPDGFIQHTMLNFGV